MCDAIEPEAGVFETQFYRDSCTIHGSKYVKDLGVVVGALREQDERLRELKRAKVGGLLSTLSHSLRDPVGSVNSLIGQQIPFVMSSDEYWNPVTQELELSRVVLVDNNLTCHQTHPLNGLLVPSFFSDPSDNQLALVRNYSLWPGHSLKDYVRIRSRMCCSACWMPQNPADVREQLRSEPLRVPNT